MKLVRNIVALSSILLPTLSIAAIPYQNEEYQFTQPNGEVVSVFLQGNTYYAEQRTRSGKLVVFDEKLNGMAYASVNKAGTGLVSTGVLVSDLDEAKSGIVSIASGPEVGLSKEAIQALVEQKQSELLPALESPLLVRTQSTDVTAQVTGQIKGLTIIIDFPDERGTISKSQVERFLNNQNYTEFGNAQSVRGYFLEVSNNKLDYTNTVTAYYTAKKNKAYYADSSLSSTVRSQELIKEALDWLEYQQGFDFSTLSTNSSNQIRGLNIFYAGNSDSAWSKGLWPHMARLSPRFCADGVCTDRYQITDMRASLSIGTFVHESGHLITNWPDLYDYDGSSHGSVASYGVMGFGAIGTTNKFRPTPPVAHFRAIAGWDTVTELNPAVDANAPTGRLSHTSGSHTSYKWTNPSNRNEAFYIEAIHKSGQNKEQPSQGLAIWHVDSKGSNSNEWYPYIQMEHADGNRDPENKVNRGDSTDLYGASGEFSSVLPNSLSSRGTNALWWNGSDSGLSISGISDPAQTISFDLDSSVVEPPKGETYRGTLANKAQQIQPNGSWFQYAGGVIKLDLNGPSNADFDLKLERWQGGSWQRVAVSETPTSVESISYNATSGYYRIIVYSYEGAGDYTLVVNK
ncbi:MULTISPECIES: M6 family metalloprotease domain-containing protein [Pseudoalteromonas]|uniref:M6 family metalloprotease domain-containing protein n=1 Tax=Pseudoalteromonas obscura TaxID=3048491 RepID=A0ABT7EQ98_9GAMM|nr:MULTISPECIES: M6 family metalloprotease domain-containing protein [Pseudoalteromonas]MBQ4834938.1 M6 family metalloprotease domain-containing protein [Pseudoalteromonas luteoviolacea]MDK2597234.1 M6 family metalloprotease domain-containing protein [Pseudoalteromonas sp. P94(2023)]